MPVSRRFLSEHDVVSGVVPLDFQTARTGDYVSLRNHRHLTVIIFKAAGTDGDDQTYTFNQATAVAGTGAKGLNVTEYMEKEGTLTSVTGWTRVTQTAASTIAPGDPNAQSQWIGVIEFDVSDLDADGGFDCVSVDNDGAGSNAQLGAILYILSEPKYGGHPPNHPDPIVD